ncbi:hypothetical protein POTOM_038319 [Populus tomentosa]|uniref:X8 domain-containing protein n=1 Tax=Populus tomentosa TaxID=118781 RepID=A0A8X7YR39_POPTO|nr:hypothetical protein POTOM_038319 [Populus tomentosa]
MNIALRQALDISPETTQHSSDTMCALTQPCKFLSYHLAQRQELLAGINYGNQYSPGFSCKLLFVAGMECACLVVLTLLPGLVAGVIFLTFVCDLEHVKMPIGLGNIHPDEEACFVGFSFSVVGATYCVCKDGVGDTQLQKSLDYACGAGADCTQIIQNAPCYQPNTVKDHCSYAVNSYFQKKGQAVGSCDFSGTAMTSATPPQNVASGCTYPASATPSLTYAFHMLSADDATFVQIILFRSLVYSFSGFSLCFYSTGTGNTPTTTTPSTGTTPTGTGTTPTGTGTSTGTGTGTPSSIIPTPPSSVFNSGLGPTGFNDNSSEAPAFKGTNLWFLASLTLLFSGIFLLWG